ncbi:hypothetical protein ACFWGM_32420 [Streptomyces roseolus]|uniref:hypothetical protein n=1 Tax=Streptomyces roseolus TaxID=67358 RepID=UPI00363DD9F1
MPLIRTSERVPIRAPLKTRLAVARKTSSSTRQRAGLATALVPRTAIDPGTPGIRTAPIEDHPILRLLFAATRHTETADPTTTAVIAALRTAARQDPLADLPPAKRDAT